MILINYAFLLEDRGSAMTNLLQMVQSFVKKDFEQDKRSFMFLFTHTDEIRGMSESINVAKNHLMDEITRTADGTNKEDIMGILKFMQICLRKKFPFVNIFILLNLT